MSREEQSDATSAREQAWLGESVGAPAPYVDDAAVPGSVSRFVSRAISWLNQICGGDPGSLGRERRSGCRGRAPGRPYDRHEGVFGSCSGFVTGAEWSP
jgi:hypothetical protein